MLSSQLLACRLQRSRHRSRRSLGRRTALRSICRRSTWVLLLLCLLLLLLLHVLPLPRPSRQLLAALPLQRRLRTNGRLVGRRSAAAAACGGGWDAYLHLALQGFGGEAASLKRSVWNGC